jgi:hypothetical protein
MCRPVASATWSKRALWPLTPGRNRGNFSMGRFCCHQLQWAIDAATLVASGNGLRRRNVSCSGPNRTYLESRGTSARKWPDLAAMQLAAVMSALGGKRTFQSVCPAASSQGRLSRAARQRHALTECCRRSRRPDESHRAPADRSEQLMARYSMHLPLSCSCLRQCSALRHKPFQIDAGNQTFAARWPNRGRTAIN